MLLAALAVATMSVDPGAAAAVDACLADAAASSKPCDRAWRGIRLRLDPALKGSLRMLGGASWTVVCPYDVVHEAGGCALVSKGVMFLQPYRRDAPAIVWGDRNAERRERTIRFGDGGTANWNDEMTSEDTRSALSLLERSKRATFSWRAAHAKAMSMTTLDMTGFADLRLLLAAMTRSAARRHEAE